MERRGIETLVGIFVFAGMALIAGLVLVFGQGNRAEYNDCQIVVAFPSASGIIKNAKVLMAGVRIGKVAAEPGINEKGDRALVSIGLKEGFEIREGARFFVRESGLLGDRYIDVQPSTNKNARVLQSGEQIEGQETSGINQIASDAKPVVEKLQTASIELDTMLRKINQEILTPETQAELKSAIANINSVSKRLDSLLAQAESGKGPLAILLKDREVAEDLKAFIANLRKKGPLFYSDTGEDKVEMPRKRR